MELATTIKIDDEPTATFLTTLAQMHGDDDTEGSISIVSAPFGSQEEGSPHLMGVRASQYVVFEHEGRHGRFDLAELFQEWVDELGDTEPVEPEGEPPDLPARRAAAKKRWEEDGEPPIRSRSEVD